MVRNQYVTVCVRDTACLYGLARRGREIADQRGCTLRVMLFAGLGRQCGENAEMLEYAFECARQMDAEMNVYYTDQPLDRLMKDSSDCLILREEEGLTGMIRRMMPEKRLVVIE